MLRKKYFKLHNWVILPDHFHLLLEIIGKKNISEVMHNLKSYSANQISKLIISSRGAAFGFEARARREASATGGDEDQISEMIITQRRRGFHASPQTLTNRRSVEASAPEGRKYVKIWQTSFYDHVIRNQTDFNNHVNYIYYNPVKHGYVQKTEDWLWSSHHKLSKG